MKYFTAITTLACAASAMAQGITIGTPNVGERIPLERPFTVQVIKNNHILASTEVAITIGVVPCPQGCPDPSKVGTVLYDGPYNPERHNDGFYQNFTVTIPFDEDLIGDSQISVNWFFLIGAQNGAVLTANGVEVETFPL